MNVEVCRKLRISKPQYDGTEEQWEIVDRNRIRWKETVYQSFQPL